MVDGEGQEQGNEEVVGGGVEGNDTQNGNKHGAVSQKIVRGWVVATPQNWTPDVRAWLVKRYKTMGMDGIYEEMLNKFDYSEHLRPDDISENLDEIMNNPDSKHYFKKNCESEYYDDEEGTPLHCALLNEDISVDIINYHFTFYYTILCYHRLHRIL